MSPHLEVRFRILKILADEPDLSQRELAQRLGVSLGKTNYLIGALVEKGWIKIGNFRRSESKIKKVAYILTPGGIRERVRLTQGYLTRKEAEYEALKAEIDTLRRQGAPNSAAPVE